MRQIVLALLIWGALALTAYGQTDPSGMVVSSAWLILAVSALLIAVGALIVFMKLAKFIDRLEEYLKKK